MSEALKGLKAQFMLFLGDFIYIDVPGGQGRSLEDYRRNYRQVYASPDWPDAAKELPWIHVYDDHEIQNDWDGMFQCEVSKYMKGFVILHCLNAVCGKPHSTTAF